MKIDCCYGCYRVWSETGELVATYYQDGSSWIIDFGDEFLFTVASESKAVEWIKKATTALIRVS